MVYSTLLILCVGLKNVNAQCGVTTFTTTGASTDWDNAAAWDQGSVPNTSGFPYDNVVINHNITKSGNIITRDCAALTINAGTMTVTGNLTVRDWGTATFTMTGGNLSVGGTTRGKVGVTMDLSSGNATLDNVVMDAGSSMSVGGVSSIADLDLTNGSSFINNAHLTIDAIDIIQNSSFENNDKLTVANDINFGGMFVLTTVFDNSDTVYCEDFLMDQLGTVVSTDGLIKTTGNFHTLSGDPIVTLTDTQLDVGGNLRIGTTTDFDMTREDICVGGYFEIQGSADVVTNDVDIKITGDFDIIGGTNMDLGADGTLDVGGTLNFNGGPTSTIALITTIDGDLDILAGADLDIDADMDVAGDFNHTGGATLTIGPDAWLEVTGEYAPDGGVTVDGTGAFAWGTYNSCAPCGVSVGCDGPPAENWSATEPAYNPLNLGACGIALPVTMLSFDVIENHEGVAELRWETIDEVNSSHFIIERSYDLKNFEPIGQITSTGYRGVNYYSFVDEADFTGPRYYRLQQFDFDGTASSGLTIPYNAGDDLKVDISPNPVDDINVGLSLYVQNLFSDRYSITVHDVVGHTLIHESYDTPASIFHHNFPLTELSAGSYLFTLTGDNGSTSQLIIIH